MRQAPVCSTNWNAGEPSSSRASRLLQGSSGPSTGRKMYCTPMLRSQATYSAAS